VLDRSAAWFSGRVLDRHPLGDHVGFLLEPDDARLGTDDARPLRFSQVRHLDPGHDA
jgi:flavin reductase (DIM6/NTAB) family NADH-FMN oxidoreductase RutF